MLNISTSPDKQGNRKGVGSNKNKMVRCFLTQERCVGMSKNSHKLKSTEKYRDPDFVGAEAVMHRAAERARCRAQETTGEMPVFRDGQLRPGPLPEGVSLPQSR